MLPTALGATAYLLLMSLPCCVTTTPLSTPRHTNILPFFDYFAAITLQLFAAMLALLLPRYAFRWPICQRCCLRLLLLSAGILYFATHKDNTRHNTTAHSCRHAMPYIIYTCRCLYILMLILMLHLLLLRVMKAPYTFYYATLLMLLLAYAPPCRRCCHAASAADAFRRAASPACLLRHDMPLDAAAYGYAATPYAMLCVATP